MMLPITTLLACGIAILFLALSWIVIKQRGRSGSSLGDNGDEALIRKIRAHANLTEFAPLLILLVGLAELKSGAPLVVGTIAAAFMLGRLMHGYALAVSNHSPIGRAGGFLLSALSIAAAVIYNLVLLGISPA